MAHGRASPMWTGSSMFVGSGACFVLGVVALVGSVHAARFAEWGKAAGAVGLGAVLTCTGIGLFWLGSSHPAFNVRNNQGFPPDWSCSTLTPAGQVCGRDVPRAPEPARPAR